MYLTLTQTKHHLNIDADYTGDDAYIISLIEVAQIAVENHLDIALSELTDAGKLPAPLIHSMLLLIGNLYANRENVNIQQIYKVPFA